MLWSKQLANGRGQQSVHPHGQRLIMHGVGRELAAGVVSIGAVGRRVCESVRAVALVSHFSV